MRNDREAFSLVLDIIHWRPFIENVSKHPSLPEQQELRLAEIAESWEAVTECLHTVPLVANTNRAVDQRGGEEATDFMMANRNGS